MALGANVLVCALFNMCMCIMHAYACVCPLAYVQHLKEGETKKIYERNEKD